MPAISYLDFGGGLDRRLPINVQDANRLWVLRNAYVTQGRKLKKRPGLRLLAVGLSGTHGLEAISDRLYAFTDNGSPFPGSGIVGKIELDPATTLPGGSLSAILSARIFQGFPYVVAQHTQAGTTVTRHHYVDGSADTNVTDANCPHSNSVTKAASRVFAIAGENVRYCAAGDARDWTTASDAGFIPAALQQDVDGSTTAVGTFQDALAVFFDEGIQIWDVAVDPSANAIRKRIYGVGARSIFQHTLSTFANDLVFLSSYGFRSMTVQQVSDRIDDTDLGVPIDSLVVPDIPLYGSRFAKWVPQLGQYWAVLGGAATSKAWVYGYSKTSKLAVWSEYTFPFAITGIATLQGKVYLRTADSLYEVAEDQYTDDNTAIDVEVQMAFQDAKSPGVTKQFWGADMVLAGSWSTSYKYDPRDQTKETIAQVLTGDTRPGDIAPVELVAPAIAPVFRHSAAEAAEIDALTLYYETLGVPG